MELDSLVYIGDFYLTFSQWAEFCTVWNQFEAGGLVYEKYQLSIPNLEENYEMISFEVQKNKLIFSKGHQKVIFPGEDYKKFKNF